MEANRAALPKPPAYARVRLEDVGREDAFGPRLRKVEKNWIGDIPISAQVHNDVAAIAAAEAKRFLMEKATPESLFAQLREMGVLCGTCRKRESKTPDGGGCQESFYGRLCDGWEVE